MSAHDDALAGAGIDPSSPSAVDDGDDIGVRYAGLLTLAWRRFRRHRPALVGAVVLCIISLATIFAPWLAPYNPNYGDFAAFSAPPSPAHIMGTDFAGRDMFSRVLYGGRVSLTIGFTSMLTALAIGTLLGSIAGYYGGWLDNAIMRLTDVVLSFPLYLLLFVLSAFLSGTQGTQNTLAIVL